MRVDAKVVSFHANCVLFNRLMAVSLDCGLAVMLQRDERKGGF